MKDYTNHYGNHTNSTDGLFWPQPHSEQQTDSSPEESLSSQPSRPAHSQTPSHIVLNESAYFPALYETAQGCLFRENLKNFRKRSEGSSHPEGSHS